MWHITIRARPNRGSKDFNRSGGAYVSCWINFADLWGARRLAWAYIEDSGWTPEVCAGAQEVQGEDCDEEHREYFDDAMVDGCAFVYHHWDIDAEDAEEDFEASG